MNETASGSIGQPEGEGFSQAKVFRTHPLDAAHLDALEEYRGANESQSNEPYAASTLAEINRLRPMPGQEEALNKLNHELLISRLYLSGSLQTGTEIFCKQFLQEVKDYGLADIEMPDELGHEELQKLANDTLKSFSSEQYEILLREHAQSMSRLNESKQPELLAMRESFLARFENLITAENLLISIEEVMRRLDQVQPRFADPWSMRREGHGHGVYDYIDGEFGIDPTTPDDLIQHVYDHESIHAIAGKTVRSGAKTSTDPDLIMRGGLHIPQTNGDFELRPARIDRFNWLDEAVTEQLSMRLRQSDEGVYDKQRSILALLSSKVAPVAFYNAYFESFEPNNGVPKWGELQQQLNSAFQPRILVILDNIIKQAPTEAEGLDEAYAYLLKVIGD